MIGPIKRRQQNNFTKVTLRTRNVSVLSQAKVTCSVMCIHAKFLFFPISVKIECSSLKDSNEQNEFLCFFFQLTILTFLSIPWTITLPFDYCTWIGG